MKNNVIEFLNSIGIDDKEQKDATAIILRLE